MGENRGVHDLDRIRYTRTCWVDSAVCVDDKGANMRLIDADALMTVGAMIAVVGFFGCMFGFLIMFCAFILGDLL